ncbi:hypothetical protein DL96DRAFT_1787933 [Flagelloscypha sp. PMI_526]|nr:hypothetical protein DL96DRAFT_1787933 [Flagelloscypha sp. PMI_526]
MAMGNASPFQTLAFLLSYSHQTTVPSPQPNSLRDTPQLERQQRRAPVPSVIPPGYPDGTTWVVDNGRPRLMIPEPHMPQHETQSPAAHSSKYRHRMHITDTTSRVNTTEGNRDRLLPAFKSSPPVTSQDLHYRSPGPNVGWRDSPREKINFPFDTVPVTPPSGLSRRSRSHSRSRPEQIPPLEQNGLPVPSVSFHPQRYNRPAPMPTVIPPGYPEGTRWIVGSGGRPKLEVHLVVIPFLQEYRLTLTKF